MTAPTGFLWSDWFHLLREVNYSIQSKYLYSAFQVTVLHRLNSRYATSGTGRIWGNNQ